VNVNQQNKDMEEKPVSLKVDGESPPAKENIASNVRKDASAVKPDKEVKDATAEKPGNTFWLGTFIQSNLFKPS